MKIINFTYHNIALINAPKIHTNLLWDLTILFAVIGIVYFTSIFFFRNKISSKSKKVVQLKKELSPMISEFLFYEGEEGTKEEKRTYVNLKIEVRELIKDQFHRKILSEILLDLQKDVSGTTKKRLFKLYKDLGLHTDAFNKLKSWRWEVVSKGILELTKMHVDEAYSFITKHINDRRSVVRKQAEIAIVTLRKEGINYFLDNTRNKVSQWQQLKLLDVIRNTEDYKPPRFKAWLTSKNKDVVLFSLRLIKYYNQSDARASIIELVKHKNNQIKEEAIDCIKKFHITEAIDVLKTVFKKNDVHIKLLILDAIGSLGSENDIEFLRKIHKKESNFNIKSKALGVINTIMPDTILPTEGIEEFADRLDELEKATVTEDYWKNKEINADNSLINENDIEIEEAVDELFNKEEINIEVKELIVEEEDITDYDTSVENFIPEQLDNNTDIDLIEEESLNQILSDTNIEVLELDEEVYLPVFSEEDIEATIFLPVVTAYDVTAEEIDEISDDLIEENKTAEQEDKAENIIPEEDFLQIDFILKEQEDVIENNTINETIDVKNYENINHHSSFFEKDDYNKTLLLDTIEDAKDEKDILLLKEILEKESNKLLKGRAWEILKDISNEEIEYYRVDTPSEEIVDIQNAAMNSIFHQLFQVSDHECKLMLLDEILEIGDAKEVVFLKSLLNDTNKEIRIKAITIIKEIQKRNNALAQEQAEDANDIESILNKELKPLKAVNFDTEEDLNYAKEVVFVPKDDLKEEDVTFNIKDSKDLLPLEFCFVLDSLDIELPKPFSVFDIDFELNERKGEAKAIKQEDTEEAPLPQESKKEQSFIDQIISLSSRIRGKSNG